jgi:hypothetical protein
MLQRKRHTVRASAIASTIYELKYIKPWRTQIWLADERAWAVVQLPGKIWRFGMQIPKPRRGRQISE